MRDLKSLRFHKVALGLLEGQIKGPDCESKSPGNKKRQQGCWRYRTDGTILPKEYCTQMNTFCQERIVKKTWQAPRESDQS
jgi:hypothetical protein